IGGAGNDTLDGGSGNDTASFAGAGNGVAVNLAAGSASGDGSDTLTGIEHAIGSGFDDTLTGDGGANRLDGAGGNDLLVGGGGNVQCDGGDGAGLPSRGRRTAELIGGAGDDTLDGGSGSDTASFAGTANAVVVDLGAGTAGGDGSDTLISIESV